MTDSGVEHHLPLSPVAYHIIVALGDGVMHGYGIMEAFEDLTEGRQVLLAGTLYATLARMSDSGFVDQVPAPKSDKSGGPRRRHYRVTDLGRSVARAESARMRRLLDLAGSRGFTPEYDG